MRYHAWRIGLDTAVLPPYLASAEFHLGSDSVLQGGLCEGPAPLPGVQTGLQPPIHAKSCLSWKGVCSLAREFEGCRPFHPVRFSLLSLFVVLN